MKEKLTDIALIGGIMLGALPFSAALCTGDTTLALVGIVMIVIGLIPMHVIE